MVPNSIINTSGIEIEKISAVDRLPEILAFQVPRKICLNLHVWFDLRLV